VAPSLTMGDALRKIGRQPDFEGASRNVLQAMRCVCELQDVEARYGHPDKVAARIAAALSLCGMGAELLAVLHRGKHFGQDDLVRAVFESQRFVVKRG
jgi:hypothetical protein